MKHIILVGGSVSACVCAGSCVGCCVCCCCCSCRVRSDEVEAKQTHDRHDVNNDETIQHDNHFAKKTESLASSVKDTLWTNFEAT